MSGNTRYLFLYEMYKANSMENLSLIFLMRYIYNSKFNNVPVNKSTFAYSYRQFNLVMVKMKLKHLKKAAEVILLMNKKLGI